MTELRSQRIEPNADHRDAGVRHSAADDTLQGVVSLSRARRRQMSAGSSDDGAALIDSLVDFGLTLNQSRVYLGLLALRSGTAVQLADRSGVPRTRIYEALEALEQAGFLSSRSGKTIVYEPVTPEIALTEWGQRREQERRLISQREDALRGELLRQLPRLDAPEPTARVGFMEALIGRERVVGTFEEMVSNADERLDIVQAPPHFQPRERWNILEAEAMARGVQVRVLYTPEVEADQTRYLGLLDAGGAGRVSNGLVLKIVLRDGLDAMVAVPDTSAGVEYAVVRITHPDLVAPLQLLFQKEWRRATQLQASR